MNHIFVKSDLFHLFTVTEPGLSLGGCTNSHSGCANLLFRIFWAENCTKMKELGPRGGGISGAPLDHPMIHLVLFLHLFLSFSDLFASSMALAVSASPGIISLRNFTIVMP